jgi:hypothetical protein
MAERVRSLRGLEGGARRELGSAERRLDQTRNELWVAGLYEQLKVGVPGPPPRPQEYEVSGQALLEGKPLPGVEVGLQEQSAALRRDQASLGNVSALKYRAVSDQRGGFCIRGVPSGRYLAATIYPVRPPAAGTAPVNPLGGFPREVTVESEAVRLPPLRFARAVETRAFGELPPAGKAVRLEWKPMPGAAGYRVDARAAFGSIWAFQMRPPREEYEAFIRRRPILWTLQNTRETRVDCPLLALAPDNAAMDARFVQYEYVVSALDAAGKEIAVSSRPLSRFFLSPAARDALLALKPRVRRNSPPPFRILRRRRGRR